MTEDLTKYREMMEYLCSAKSRGKRFMFYKGKVYSIDNNFEPPIVKEIK